MARIRSQMSRKYWTVTLLLLLGSVATPLKAVGGENAEQEGSGAAAASVASAQRPAEKSLKPLTDACVANVMRVLEDGRLFRYHCAGWEDSEASRLEKEFCDLFGFKYALAVNSCSSALLLSLTCSGVERGDIVAMPAFTFIAVPSAIVHAGATPLLIDVTDDYVMDVDDFEEKITQHPIKALMLSYMRGRVPDVDRIVRLCDANGILLLEDAAHALGVLWKGRQMGSFGVAGSVSFQSHKIVDGGEGGMLFTNDKDLARKAMLYSGAYETNWKKHFLPDEEDTEALQEMTNGLPAYNFRISNLAAAAIRPQLAGVEERVERFNRNFAILAAHLSTLPEVRLPSVLPDVRPAADSIQFEFKTLKGPALEGIAAALKEEGYKMNLFSGSNARCFWNWSFFPHATSCERTKAVLVNSVDMRLRLHLTEADVHRLGGLLSSLIQEAVSREA